MQSVINEEVKEESSEGDDGPFLFSGMPRLQVDLYDAQPVIVSYQNDYLDFLDENNYIDVSSQIAF